MAELDQFALHPPVPQRGLSVAMRITSLRIAAARPWTAAGHSSHTSASSMTHCSLHPPPDLLTFVP